MKIRKLFKVESSHIVRNCSSDRCSKSVHGHSAKIEIVLESSGLDDAGMVYDFGLMKGSIKEFIDSMDHCHIMWNKDSEEYKNFFKKYNERWIELPFNPSAEMLSLFIFHVVKHIIEHTDKKNNESDIIVNSVRYHETDTGWAECNADDYERLWDHNWDYKLTFSEKCLSNVNDYLYDHIFVNPEPNRQIKIVQYEN